MTKGYLLDTNVVSELMNDAPAREVMVWFEHNAASPMYTSSVTQAVGATGRSAANSATQPVRLVFLPVGDKIGQKQAEGTLLMQPQQDIDHVFDKLKRLPPERISEVEAFIDFLNQRRDDAAITQAAKRVSEPVLAQVWDNVEDAVYDAV